MEPNGARQWLAVPEDAITEILLGVRYTVEDEDAMLELLERRSGAVLPLVNLYRAHLSRNSFLMGFVTVRTYHQFKS